MKYNLQVYLMSALEGLIVVLVKYIMIMYNNDVCVMTENNNVAHALVIAVAVPVLLT